MRNRLQWQLLLIACAGVLVAATAFVLIRDVVTSAERVVISDTQKQLTAAVAELERQYRDRVTTDSSWAALPEPAQELSLRSLSFAVLRAYPGVEGGYAIRRHLLGYAYPTHDAGAAKTDIPEAERPSIEKTAYSAAEDHSASQLLRGSRDLVLIEARQVTGNSSAWVMKRIPNQAATSAFRHNAMSGALALLALCGIAAALATALRLRSGLAEVQSGLLSLEHSPDYRLPERLDELGTISASINRMANSRQKIESELRRADRMRAMGRLVASVAHEIRNPLNSIRLAIQVVERRFATGGAPEFQAVQAEVDRLNRLLSDLLAFGSNSPGPGVVRDIGELAGECARLVQQDAGSRRVRLEVAAGPAPLTACLDENRFRQALFNILLNAIQATPPGGLVRMEIFQDQQHAVVRVGDSGPGLSDDQRDHLFEAFYSTKPGGTGLGLAVSTELMAAMGGSLLFEGNQPGAVFALRLPLAKEHTYAQHNSSDRRG